MRYKPRFLPQISAPYNVVVEKLNLEGIDNEVVTVNPKDLNVSQGIVFSNEVAETNVNDLHPIWLDAENNVLDGHHRLIKALYDGIPSIKAVKVKLNQKDACRILNKIQDIYEYENQQGMEETVQDDVINFYNNKDSGVSDSEFLASLEEDNSIISSEKPEGALNPKTLTAYRKNPIKENSVIGNFFTLKPIDGYVAYEIEFDNLLDTNELGITYKNSQVPVEILAKIWFPHINFEKLSEQYKVPSINLKNKAITKKAMSLGYDGIKYGDTLLQGLK